MIKPARESIPPKRYRAEAEASGFELLETGDSDVMLGGAAKTWRRARGPASSSSAAEGWSKWPKGARRSPKTSGAEYWSEVAREDQQLLLTLEEISDEKCLVRV